MEQNLKVCTNYDNLSMKSLLVLLKGFDRVYFSKKVPILQTIVVKYFRDKSSVNLYSLLLKHTKFGKKEEMLDFLLAVLSQELKPNTEILPLEYREDFFKVLIYFLSSVDEFAKSHNTLIEWDLLNMPILLTYLSELDKTDIISTSLRQKINVLVDSIRKQYEQKLEDKKENDKNNVSLVAMNNNSLSIEETGEKLNQIKTLKLKKSKLNKSSFCEALCAFKYYNDEDKDYLINYMYKHNWCDCVTDIDPIVAFDYFSKHIEFTAFSHRFNPFKLLYGIFNKLFIQYSPKQLEKLKEYFGVDNINDLMRKVKEWYLSYNGTTEDGWIYYEKSLFAGFFKDTHSSVGTGSDSELESYAKVNATFDCIFILNYFNQYKDVNILEWFKSVELPTEKKLKDFPIWSCGVVTEYIEEKVIQKSAIEYYLDIYNFYYNVLFNYHGSFVEYEEITYDAVVSDELKSVLYDFIHIIDTVKFSGEDLVILEKSRNWSCYNWRDKDNLKECASRLIMNYFCRNYKSITKEQVKDIWFNEEHYKSFCFFTDYRNNTGLFKDSDDYAVFFFELLKEELDFSRVEDLKLFFRLKGNLNVSSKFFKLFYEKLEKDCPECFNILSDFTDSIVDYFERDIVLFVKTFYNIV